MTKIAAIVSFILSLCLYSWSIHQGTVVTWQFWMILGFALAAAGDDPRMP